MSQIIGFGILQDEYLYVVSGVLLALMSYVLHRHFRIDPIDAGLLINEQAINLTA
jgi:hypothetical protein